jgi:hypothetical protein
LNLIFHKWNKAIHRLNECFELRSINSLASDNTTIFGDETTENEGGDSGELDQNVDSGAGGVLKWVTDGIANNGSLVLIVTLFDKFGLTGSDSFVSASKKTGFGVLLGVVPSTTSVGGRESNLDAADNGTGEEAGNATVTE